MADLAFVFHWPPAVLDAMPLGEIMSWHAEAVKRHNPPES